jgi:hypothetical protein
MTRRKPVNKAIEFDYDVSCLMTQLLSFHLQSEVYNYDIKNKFSMNKFDFKEIFENMDVDENGFLTMNEVNINK